MKKNEKLVKYYKDEVQPGLKIRYNQLNVCRDCYGEKIDGMMEDTGICSICSSSHDILNPYIYKKFMEVKDKFSSEK